MPMLPMRKKRKKPKQQQWMCNEIDGLETIRSLLLGWSAPTESLLEVRAGRRLRANRSRCPILPRIEATVNWWADRIPRLLDTQKNKAGIETEFEALIAASLDEIFHWAREQQKWRTRRMRQQRRPDSAETVHPRKQ